MTLRMPKTQGAKRFVAPDACRKRMWSTVMT